MTRSRRWVRSIASLKPEAARDLLRRRIPQRQLAAADQYRDVGDADVKAIEQLLHVGLAVQVDVRVRMPVTRQELLHAQRRRRMRRSDQHRVAEPREDQLHPAEDERPHENLAQLRVGLDQPQHLLARELDDAPGRADSGATVSSAWG